MVLICFMPFSIKLFYLKKKKKEKKEGNIYEKYLGVNQLAKAFLSAKRIFPETEEVAEGYGSSETIDPNLIPLPDTRTLSQHSRPHNFRRRRHSRGSKTAQR